MKKARKLACGVIGLTLLGGCEFNTTSKWVQMEHFIHADNYYSHSMAANEDGPLLGISFQNSELRTKYIENKSIIAQEVISGGENMYVLYELTDEEITPITGRDTSGEYKNCELNVSNTYTSYSTYTGSIYGNYLSAIVNGDNGVYALDGKVHGQVIKTIEEKEYLFDLTAGVSGSYEYEGETFYFGDDNLTLRNFKLEALLKTESYDYIWNEVKKVEVGTSADITDIQLFLNDDILTAFWIKDNTIFGAEGETLENSITMFTNNEATSIDCLAIEGTIYILSVTESETILFSKSKEATAWNTIRTIEGQIKKGIIAMGYKTPILFLIDQNNNLSSYSGLEYNKIDLVCENCSDISAVVAQNNCFISVFISDKSTAEDEDDGDIKIFKSYLF